MSSHYSMRQLPRALVIALVLLLGVAATGCGDEEEGRPLTEGKSERLLDLLDEAERQFEDGECDELEGTLEDLADEVNKVDPEVEQGVREALDSETQELINMATEDCEEPEIITETETVPTTTFETVPPTTEETEPTTTEEETEPEEPPGQGPEGEGPPGQGNDDGGPDSGEVTPPAEPTGPEEARGGGGET